MNDLIQHIINDLALTPEQQVYISESDIKRIVLSKYKGQKGNAKQRGIEFLLTFDEWCDIWHKSGKYSLRGIYKGSYVMGRHNDEGPYKVGNVAIISRKENNRVAGVYRHAKGILPLTDKDTNKGMMLKRKYPELKQHSTKELMELKIWTHTKPDSIKLLPEVKSLVKNKSIVIESLFEQQE